MTLYFRGASAHIDLFELPRTSVSGHIGQTEASLDAGETLAGSSDEIYRTHEWDFRAFADRARRCYHRKVGSSAFFSKKKGGGNIPYSFSTSSARVDRI
jgi:hypothetical protein